MQVILMHCQARPLRLLVRLVLLQVLEQMNLSRSIGSVKPRRDQQQHWALRQP